MLTFFHSRRRKMGAATLLVACVFMAAWVRGQTTFDRVYFGWRDRYCVFHFSNETLGPHRGIFLLYGKYSPPDDSFQSEWISSSNTMFTPQRLKELIDEDSSYENSAEAIAEGLWSWKGIGFLVGGTHTYSKVAIPYWSIVIPLTLLSAYLLLSKPRLMPNQQVTNA